MSISARAASVPRRAAMPKARWTSALLTTMSTLPPISPASSTTDRPSLRSSGTSVTGASAVMSSRPGSFFHGSAWPTQTISAPACTSACTSAWPTAVLPSVTRIFLNRGSLAISRSILSSAMCSLSSGGNPISTAAPARSRRAPTWTRTPDCGGAAAGRRLAGCAGAAAPCLASRRRCDVAVQMDDHGRPGVEADEAEPPRQSLAIERVVAVVEHGLAQQLAVARLRPPHELAPRGSGGRRRAAGIAPPRSARTPAARSVLRRRPRSCRGRCGRAPTAAGSSAAFAAPGSCRRGFISGIVIAPDPSLRPTS